MERLVKPKKLKRKRKHGFRHRMKTGGGRRVLKRKRIKKKKRLAL